MYLLPIFLTLIALASTAPATYDQRQDGKLNVHAKLENLLILVAPSMGSMSGLDFDLTSLLDQDLNFRKTTKDELDKYDADIMELEKLPEFKEKAAGEPSVKRDDLKLIGEAIENCGPGRFRNQYGVCEADGAGEK
uniref:Uncharacterized protein n=1 Tax=Bracon brevicornis TaxID=1563983 RepID=A0A6V7J3V6_9HYME